MDKAATPFATGLVLGVTGLYLLKTLFKRAPKKPKNVKLTYFNISGVAEKVRLAFALADISFEDDRINFPDWPELKKTMRYGQVPVLTIDGKQVYQSLAMLKWAAAFKPTLYPSSPCKRLEVDEVLGLAMDFDKAWSPALYMGMYPDKFGYEKDSNKAETGKARTKAIRERFVAEDLPRFMGYYTNKLEQTGAFFCGAEPTIADLYILPQLRAFQAGHIDYVDTSCLDSYPVVMQWIDRMLSVPEIKAWYAKKN